MPSGCASCASTACRISDHRATAPTEVLIEQYLEVGYNYRMTDVQAAIGIEQMQRLDGILVRRAHAGPAVHRRLRELPGVQVPFVPGRAAAQLAVVRDSADEGFSAGPQRPARALCSSAASRAGAAS